MVQLIDFNKLDCIKLKREELTIVQITIEENGLLDYDNKTLYEMVNKHVVAAISTTAIPSNSNLWFEINIKDDTLKKDEYMILYRLCANIIAANLLSGEIRDREPRLKVPAALQTDGLLGLIWLRRMINEKLVCDVVGGVVQINKKKRGLV